MTDPAQNRPKRKRGRIAPVALRRYHELMPAHLFPINVARGIIHIHIPKTAGTAIRQALFGSRVVKHVPATSIDIALWEALPSFSIVRDPLRRFVSNYKYHCHTKYSGALLKQNPDLKELTVEQYADRFLEENQLLDSQVSYITRSDSEKKQIDVVVKFEEIELGLKEIARLTGVDIKMNKVKVGPEIDIPITGELRNRIETRYKDDYDLLGY